MGDRCFDFFTEGSAVWAISTARICITGMFLNLIEINYVIANVLQQVNAEYQITTNIVLCKCL